MVASKCYFVSSRRSGITNDILAHKELKMKNNWLVTGVSVTLTILGINYLPSLFSGGEREEPQPQPHVVKKTAKPNKEVLSLEDIKNDMRQLQNKVRSISIKKQEQPQPQQQQKPQKALNASKKKITEVLEKELSNLGLVKIQIERQIERVETYFEIRTTQNKINQALVEENAKEKERIKEKDANAKKKKRTTFLPLDLEDKKISLARKKSLLEFEAKKLQRIKKARLLVLESLKRLNEVEIKKVKEGIDSLEK